MEIQRGSNDRTPDGGSRNSRPIATRVLGVGLALAVVALPVLFSGDSNEWTEIHTESGYALTPGLVLNGPAHLALAMNVLLRPGPTNETRLDYSSPLTVTSEHAGALAFDLTDVNVTPGPLLPDLSGYCCFSEAAFSPDSEIMNFTGTAPGGVLKHIEVSLPIVGVATSNVDPFGINGHFSGDYEVTSRGQLTLTSSTNTDETLVYGNTSTADQVWNLVISRTSNTVFDNDHPGLAANPVTGEGFLFYTLGTDANLLKFDTVTGATIWEEFEVVSLGTPPAETFRYFQVVEDEGKVALLAPRNTDTVMVFIDDADSSTPPASVQYHTIPGDPWGDHQILQLDNNIVTTVYPDQDGTGTEIRHVAFNPDPALPPNVMTVVDDTVTGAWHNTAPGYAVFLTDTENPNSAVVYDLKPNRLFVVQGDPDNDLIRYGTFEVPIFFDGFESGTLTFWGN